MFTLVSSMLSLVDQRAGGKNAAVVVGFFVFPRGRGRLLQVVFSIWVAEGISELCWLIIDTHAKSLLHLNSYFY